MFNAEKQQVCRSFAGLMDYPGETLKPRVEKFIGELARTGPRQLKSVRRFAESVENKPPGSLEELYAQTFDLTAANSLYLGYHLFGETPKRSAFMAKLQEAYQKLNFSPGSELPDHLCVVLRFLSLSPDREFCRPLIQECLLPALARTEQALLKEDNPYGWLMQALRTFLETAAGKIEKDGGARNA